MTHADTIPAPPSAPIPAGKAMLTLVTALATVAQALERVEAAVLAYDALAVGIARQLDATTKT